MRELRIEGYGAIFDDPDADYDVIFPGAFRDTLELPHRAMLWNHEGGMPCGYWTRMEERERGLWCEGVVLDFQHFGMVERGAVCGLSIGYEAAAQKRLVGGGRGLVTLDLVEVSLTPTPLHPMCLFSVVP